jgi:hypothetical protein
MVLLLKVFVSTLGLVHAHFTYSNDRRKSDLKKIKCNQGNQTFSRLMDAKKRNKIKIGTPNFRNFEGVLSAQ